MTTFRIVMAIVAAWCFTARTAEVAAVVLCAVAALLDAFDGWYARRYSQCTRLGEHLDPLADKMLMAVVYGVIAWRMNSPVLWAVVGLVAFREMGMTLFRAYSLRRFKKFIPANRLGKAKMILQSTFGLLVLGYAYLLDAGFGFPLPVVLLPLLVILVLSYYSAVVYLVGWKNARTIPRDEAIADVCELKTTEDEYHRSGRAVAGE
jgi:CDP-diacylglycerol--glycerol-3-phosphate 3-phosphatidyltransferase